jgi:hypothetical protein
MGLAEFAACDRIGAAARRMTAAAWCAALAAAVATASIGCAVAALWVFVLPEAGPAGAPLIAAAALLVLCFALLAIIRSLVRRRPAPTPGAAAPGAAVLIAETLRLFEHNKNAALLAALLAGAAAGGLDRK